MEREVAGKQYHGRSDKTTEVNFIILRAEAAQLSKTGFGGGSLIKFPVEWSRQHQSGTMGEERHTATAAQGTQYCLQRIRESQGRFRHINSSQKKLNRSPALASRKELLPPQQQPTRRAPLKDEEKRFQSLHRSQWLHCSK